MFVAVLIRHKVIIQRSILASFSLSFWFHDPHIFRFILAALINFALTNSLDTVTLLNLLLQSLLNSAKQCASAGEAASSAGRK